MLTIKNVILNALNLKSPGRFLAVIKRNILGLLSIALLNDLERDIRLNSLQFTGAFPPLKIQDIVFLTHVFLIPFCFPREKRQSRDLASLWSSFSKYFFLGLDAKCYRHHFTTKVFLLGCLLPILFVFPFLG